MAKGAAPWMVWQDTRERAGEGGGSWKGEGEGEAELRSKLRNVQPTCAPAVPRSLGLVPFLFLVGATGVAPCAGDVPYHGMPSRLSPVTG